MYFHFQVPLIHEFSVKIQISILLALLLASYLHRGARFSIGGIATAYLAFKILVPVCQLLFYIFKAIAMFGFYMRYFYIGIGMIATGAMFVYSYVLELLEEIKKTDRERDNGR